MKMWTLYGIFFAIFTVAYVNSQCNPSPCGINAECENSGRRAVCKCPRGFTGNVKIMY